MAHKNLFKKSGFTLAEMLVSASIMVLVVTAAWAVYVLGWTWWYEVSPRIDAQRIARLAMEKIVEGVSDPTAGYDMIGGIRYDKRNGIAATYYFPPALPDSYTNSEGTTVSNKINYGLYQDYNTHPPESSANNIRSFYLGTDAGTGLKAVYYKDSNSAVHMLKDTLGITNLEFSYYVDKDVTPNVTYNDIIVVRVVVEKDVSAVGHTPYHINIHYGYDDTVRLNCGSTVYLRNAPQT
jgi:prepilin-type N-terminal cleavage/methylation domain-containing protein